jgi:hypothetical protein
MVIMLIYFIIACFIPFVLINVNYTKEGTTNWVIVGGLTPSQATFRIRKFSRVAQLKIAKDEDLSNIVFEDTTITEDASNDDLVISLTATSLDSSTRYYYASLDSTGNILKRGTFRTAGLEDQRNNFKFATAGCSWTGSKHPIYSTIRDEDPLFFLHLGDFHYQDLDADNVERRIHAVDRVLNSESQQDLFSIPLVYMYDDHDWLGNDSTGVGEGREAALESYRKAFPYYPPLSSNSSATYHAFTIGTVRFIVSDLRSEVIDKSMFSKEQRDWLYDELSLSSNYDFVVWVTTKTWIGEAEEGDDSWSGYPTDRQELSDWISAVVPNNLIAIASDAHMIAFDDGSNTYYGKNANISDSPLSFPILQSGPLDRLGSFKGGPYSEGCTSFIWERNHQYSVIEFQWEGDEPCLEIKTYRIQGTSTRQEIFTKKLCGDIFSPSNPGEGSCDVKHLSTTNTAVVAVSAGLVAVSFIQTCFLGFGYLPAFITSCLILIAFGSTLFVGLFIPIMKDIDQYDAFETGLIVLLQMITVVLYLLAWKYCGGKKEHTDCDGPAAAEPQSDVQVAVVEHDK